MHRCRDTRPVGETTRKAQLAAMSHPMPDSLVRLAECIGWDVVQTLIARYPGMRLRIPVKVDAEHPLAQQLGLEAAQKLVKMYCGEELFIAKGDAYFRACRNARIVEQYQRGAKVPELVRHYHLTDRQIYNILASPVADERQLSIF